MHINVSRALVEADQHRDYKLIGGYRKVGSIYMMNTAGYHCVARSLFQNPINTGMTFVSAAITSNLRHRDPPNTPQPSFANVVWLMGFEGGTGTGTFTEESSNGFTVTPNFSANRSTTQAKFGSNSGETIGGTQSRFTVDDNAALEPGSSDFSVEGFVFNEAIGVDATFFCCWHGSTERTHIWWWDTSAGNMVYEYSTTGSTVANTFTASWAMAQDTWYHIAICRNGPTLECLLTEHR